MMDSRKAVFSWISLLSFRWACEVNTVNGRAPARSAGTAAAAVPPRPASLRRLKSPPPPPDPVATPLENTAPSGTGWRPRISGAMPLVCALPRSTHQLGHRRLIAQAAAADDDDDAGATPPLAMPMPKPMRRRMAL
eukprot:COSAG01_NODE_13587_length_1563_cov_1.796448_1_plen_135_part_10